MPPELLTAASVFPPALAPLPPATPIAPLLAADEPERLAVIEPEETALHVTPGSPVVLRFNRPMVELAKTGKPTTDAPARFRPELRTTQTWLTRALLRIDAEATTWDRTRIATLTLAPGLSSLGSERLQEFEPRTVVFDSSPSYRGRRSERIIAGEPVTLFFDGKPSIGELSQRMLVYEVDGGRRMMPFTLRQVIRDDKGRMPVELKPARALEPGAKFAVALAPVLSRGGASPRVVEFEFAPRPRIEGISCAAGAMSADQCEHTSPPAAVVDIGERLVLLASTELKELATSDVQVSPALPAMNVKLEDSRRLVIQGEWAPGQVYEVRVGALKDSEGHALARFPPLAVRSKGRTPEVRVATGRLTFERAATPALAFAAIHVHDGVLRWAPIPAGQEFAAAASPRELLLPGSALMRELPLQPMVPDARPNRWGRATFPWVQHEPSRAPVALFSFLPDRSERDPESIPTTLAQWTDLGINARLLATGLSVWVTSIGAAAPLADVVVRAADSTGTDVGGATTNGDGIAWIGVESGVLSKGAIVRAERGDDRAVLVIDPRASIGPRHLSIAPGEQAPREDTPVAAVFTDRGMCRPGETIHSHVVVRTPGAQPKAVTSGTVKLQLFGPATQAPIATREVALDSFGGASADFAVEPSREPGTYRIEARRAPFESPLGAAAFVVGDYRPPVLRVDLQSQSPAASLIEGETLRAAISAVYPFGSPAAGARATWALSRSGGGSEMPPRWAQFTFSPVDASSRSGTIDTGEIVLDRQGAGLIEARMSMGSPLRQSSSLEVTVRDSSGQTTSARQSFFTFPAAFEVGIRHTPDWLEADSMLDVETIVVSNDGAPAPGRRVEATITREGWHGWWQWSPRAYGGGYDDEEPGDYRARKSSEKTVVRRCKLVSAEEPVHCTWKAERAGTYRLEARTTDDNGRPSFASVRVYVAAPDEHPDRDAPGSAISLTAAKSSLHTGELAELAFESPFPDAVALLRVERQGILHTEQRRVGAGGQVMKFPVTAAMVPNAYVSVALVRPRTGPPGEKLDLHAPDLRVGTRELTVRPALPALHVELKLPTDRARAATELAIEARVTGPGGTPARSQVTLYAVDEGTLRLTGYRTPELHDALFPRMGATFAWDDVRRTLVSRVESDLFPSAGGDGATSAESPAQPELREWFEPTPMWKPGLVTDAAGVVRASLHLPERPAEYRVMAVAIDEGARTAHAEARLIATRAIVARPVLPRFALEGDTFEAVTFLRNTTDTRLEVSWTATVAGAARPTRVLHLEPGAEERVSEGIGPVAGTSLPLRLRIEGGGELQELAREVPIEARARKVRSEIVGAVERERPVTLRLPAESARRAGELSLSIASHPLIGFDVALEALEACTWGGVEPMAASLIGLAAYSKLDSGRRPERASGEELRVRATRFIRRLQALQTPAGGFGRYSGVESPEPYLSVYAIHALLAGREAGWEVPEEVIHRAVHWLTEQSKGSTFLDANEDRGRDELARALRVLSQASAADTGRIQALYEQRQALSPVGLAHLALAMDRSDRRRFGLVHEAMRRVLATRQDERRDPTLLRWYDSSARTYGAVLEAACSLEPMHPESRSLVSKLLELRMADGLRSWWSTHETSHALAGLAAYAARFSEGGRVVVEVKLDGKVLAPREGKGAQVWYALPVAGLAGGEHQLELSGPGQSFFALSGQWDVPLGADDEVARGSAVALHRVLVNEAGVPLEGAAHVKLGELVRVRLFAWSESQAPAFVVIRDRFAGGLEPIDAGHETAPREALWSLLGMEPGEEELDVRGHYAARTLPNIEHRGFTEREARFELGSTIGLQELTYGVRATVPGTFVIPPAELRARYAPGFEARSGVNTIVVEP